MLPRHPRPANSGRGAPGRGEPPSSARGPTGSAPALSAQAHLGRLRWPTCGSSGCRLPQRGARCPPDSHQQPLDLPGPTDFTRGSVMAGALPSPLCSPRAPFPTLPPTASLWKDEVSGWGGARALGRGGVNEPSLWKVTFSPKDG